MGLSSSAAVSLFFDTLNNGFPSVANNVQKAIESALFLDPQTTIGILFDDFINMMTWSPSMSGVGAEASVGGGNSTYASGKHIGVARLMLGAVVPAHSSLVQSGTLSTSTVFGGGAAEYQTLILIPALATATEDYTFRVGFGTSVNTDHADGIYFEYDRSNSLNWRLKAASNSVRTVVTSSVAVTANTWTHLKWVVNSDGTNTDFYIDKTLVGSITTNIPTVTGRGCGPNYQLIQTSVSIGGQSIVMDYSYFFKRFTARD